MSKFARDPAQTCASLRRQGSPTACARQALASDRQAEHRPPRAYPRVVDAQPSPQPDPACSRHNQSAAEQRKRRAPPALRGVRLDSHFAAGGPVDLNSGGNRELVAALQIQVTPRSIAVLAGSFPVHAARAKNTAVRIRRGLS